VDCVVSPAVGMRFISAASGRRQRSAPSTARSNDSSVPSSAVVMWVPSGTSSGQGLTLVRRSAQLEPCLTQKSPYTPLTPPNTHLTRATDPYAHPLSHTKRSS